MVEEIGNEQSIGGRLQQLRNNKLLTQEELAEILHVSRQSVSKWELNKTLPDIEKLIQLSEMYQVSLDYIIRGNIGTEGSALQNKRDIPDHSELPDEKEFLKEDKIQKKLHAERRTVLLLCGIINGIICLTMLCFAGNLLLKQVYQKNNKETDMVCVDRIYEQYTKAEVVGVTKEGDFFKENVWLDVPGVRADDFVEYYYDEAHSDKVLLDYYSKTILLPVVFFLLSLLFGITFIVEWKSIK